MDDAIRLKTRFELFKLYGGEPVLHPQIGAVCEIIDQYRQFHLNCVKQSPFKENRCKFVCDTNGCPSSMKLIEEKLPKWFSLQNADTLNTKIWKIFTSVNVAPIDTPEYRNEDKLFREGCQMTTVCGGVSLHCNEQFYPCPVAGHIDRVFKLNTGVPDLQTFLMGGPNAYREVFQKTCRYCGWFKYPREIVDEQQISPSWEKAIQDHKNNIPVFI